MAQAFDVNAQILEAYRAAIHQSQIQFIEAYKFSAEGQLRQIFANELYEDAVRLRNAMYINELNKNQYRRKVDAQIKRNTAQGINYAVSLSMTDVINNTVAQVTGETQVAMTQIGRVFGQAIRNRSSSRLKINQAIADEAIAAMLARYDEVRKGRPAGSARSAYRQNERFSGGLLRSALASPSQAQPTLDGIVFLNTTLLDQTAKQWARLNFGAGPRAGMRTGQSSSAYPGRNLLGRGNFRTNAEFLSSALGDGVPAFQTKLPYGPKGAFWMPAGFWMETTTSPIGASRSRTGQDAFFLKIDKTKQLNNIGSRKGKVSSFRQDRKLTQGVQAWGFLEAGMNVIARELPYQTGNFLQQVFDEAKINYEASIPGKLAVSTPTVARAALLLDQQSASLIQSLASRGLY